MARGNPPKGYVWNPTTRRYEKKKKRTTQRPYRGASGPLSGTPSHQEREKKDNIRAMQEFLRKKGYRIEANGRMDARTRSAVADWHKGVGQRNPTRWSNRHGVPVRPDDRPGPRPTPTSLAPKPQRPKPKAAQRPKPKAAQRPTPAPKATAAPAAGGVAGTSTIGGLQPFDPDLASKLAGLQFDPQIKLAEEQGLRVEAQGAQNLADIKNWYNEVLASQATAKQRDAAMIASGVSGVGDVSADIVSSLGGGANPGAGVVGAAGAEAAATLQAIGAAGNEYNEDIRPLLQAEGAGVSARETALQSQRAREVAAQIMGLKGERGAAEAAAQIDIQKMNNELSQQDFQNALAIEQTIQAAKMAGLQLNEQKLRNQLMQQELQTSQTPSQPGQFVPWARLPLPDRVNLAQSIVAHVLPSGFARGNEAQTFAKLKRYAATLGYNHPQLLTLLRQAARDAVRKSKTASGNN